MDEYTVTELAYKNGYRKALQDMLNELDNDTAEQLKVIANKLLENKHLECIM